MTKQEILNHKDYDAGSHVNTLYCEFDECWYHIVETSNTFEVYKI